MKNWKNMCSQLKLVSGEVSLASQETPTSINYMFPTSGYAPVSIREIQALLQLKPSISPSQNWSKLSQGQYIYISASQKLHLLVNSLVNDAQTSQF